MLYQVKNQIGGYSDEPVYRVVNNLSLIQMIVIYCKNDKINKAINTVMLIFVNYHVKP